MSESNLWSKIRVKMHGRWDGADRHEDKLQEGVADVSFTCGGLHGWMELKHLNRWPARPQTVVRIDHFTVEQFNWLRRKGKAGGRTWMFIQIDRDHLLIHWSRLENVGKVNKAGLIELAHHYWPRRMDWDMLAQILSTTR